MKRNTLQHARARRGVTLTEMIVAVGITVSMLATVGIVFKSATDAAGKAGANNLIMQDLRAMTGQMQQDFTGFRPDLPFAVVWESDLHDPDGISNSGDEYDVRQDRIVFFANGDFQVSDWGTINTVSGNLAQIFYGQSLDTPVTPPESLAPDRKYLTRRYKLFTADTTIAWASYVFGNGSEFDILPISFNPVNSVWANIAFWENEPFTNYYFDTAASRLYFLNNPAATYSWIRRPNLSAISILADGYAALQRLLLGGDVTDFKIELWFPGATEWFPNQTDIYQINIANSAGLAPDPLTIPFFSSALGALSSPVYGTVTDYFAFYWNTQPDLAPPGAPGTVDVSVFEDNLGGGAVDVEWRGEAAMRHLLSPIDLPNNIYGVTPWSGTWPEAVKFTFTLYDKNRRFFPDGQTYSYVVRIPPRD